MYLKTVTERNWVFLERVLSEKINETITGGLSTLKKRVIKVDDV